VAYCYASLLVTVAYLGFSVCIITVPQKGEVGSGAAGNHANYWWWLVGVASAVLLTTSIGCPG